MFSNNQNRCSNQPCSNSISGSVENSLFQPERPKNEKRVQIRILGKSAKATPPFGAQRLLSQIQSKKPPPPKNLSNCSLRCVTDKHHIFRRCFAGLTQNSTPFCALIPSRKGCFTLPISVTISAASINSSFAFRPVKTTWVINGFSACKNSTTSSMFK